jgi:hypothetical protein
VRIPLGLALALSALCFGSLAPNAAAANTELYWGAYISGAPRDTSLIDAFEARVGKRAALIQFGQAWFHSGKYLPFPTADLQRVRDRGSIPVLNWTSWDYCCGEEQPRFRLNSISGGAHDAYITEWARAAKAWGHPMFLRFDHEMNGWWYPWNEQVNGNQEGDFVRAWRHVHDIFTSQGATNVTWVWCPNIVSPFSTPTAAVYPGDAYVDWTCMDGYNWGTDMNNAWQTFSQVTSGSPSYGGHNTYQELLDVAPSKPIMLAEMASSERGGSKAAWITDMLTAQLPTNFPQIKAVIWFNWNANDPSLSWPVESSPAALSAFVQGIASPYYASNTFGALNTAPIQPADGPVIVKPPAPPSSVSDPAQPSDSQMGDPEPAPASPDEDQPDPPE